MDLPILRETSVWYGSASVQSTILLEKEWYNKGMLEKDFQAKFIARLRKLGCKCYKQQMNATTRVGTPDYIVLVGPVWIFLEFKKAKNSPKRPGQQKNIDYANEVSFGWFVYPGVEDEIYEEIRRLI